MAHLLASTQDWNRSLRARENSRLLQNFCAGVCIVLRAAGLSIVLVSMEVNISSSAEAKQRSSGRGSSGPARMTKKCWARFLAHCHGVCDAFAAPVVRCSGNQRQELRTLRLIFLQVAEHRRSYGLLSSHGDAARFHAHVATADDHAYRAGL